MSNIEKQLMPGEQLVHEAKLHWIIFFWPIVLTFFVGLPILMSAVGFHSFAGILAGLVCLAFFWLPAIFNYAFSEFALTTKRVFGKRGLISRHSVDILLTKIEGINYDQNLIGRLFGYGTVVVRGTGGSKELFPRIVSPATFQEKVHQQLAV